jgi:hypothetical protein
MSTIGEYIDRVARDITPTDTEKTTYALVKVLVYTRHLQGLERNGGGNDNGVKMAAVQGGMDTHKP